MSYFGGMSVGLFLGAGMALQGLVYYSKNYDVQPLVADVGVKFENAAAVATMCDRKALQEKEIKAALEQAFNDYRQGKNGVIRLNIAPNSDCALVPAK